MVRKRAALQRLRSAAVRLFVPDPLQERDLREPENAGSRLRRRRGPVVRRHRPRPGLRRAPQRSAAAHVHAVPDRRHGGGKPGDGLAHVPVFGGRRDGHRLASGASRRVRRRRRRAGLHRDDRRFPGRPHQPPAAPACTRRNTWTPGSGSSISSTTTAAPRSAFSWPMRGRRGRPSFHGRGTTSPSTRATGTSFRPRPGPTRRAIRCRRRWTGPIWTRSGTTSPARPKWRTGQGSTCSKSTWPTAICCRASSRRSPTCGPTNMAGRSGTG